MELLILCGGLGKRLRPFTLETPKPLIPVLNKPVIEYQLDFFKRHGIKDIVLCTGYKNEIFQEKYPDLIHSVEKSPLGTAGAIKNAEKHITEDFVVTNGDNVFSFNFQKMQKKFFDVRNPTLALAQLVSPYGIIDVESERIVQFREKPILNLWINAGITIFNQDSLDYFPDKGMIEIDVYPKLVKDRKLFAFKMEPGAFWTAIDTPKDVENAEKILLKR